VIWTPRPGRRVATALAGVAISATVLAGCSSSPGSTHPAHGAQAAQEVGAVAPTAVISARTAAEIHLYTTMRRLWSQHMEWTYATVNAFFHNQHALTPTLHRLLKNQRDLGAAIVPFYGQAAGDKLTDLLLTHINDAVPVLQAAQAGDTTALNKALRAWYANAKRIADFLSAANPRNWPKSATEPMMKEHITQTTTYSVDLLKGHFALAIRDYGKAERHMAMMADVLSKGIIAQFPRKFAG
jgi:hypothetical protein